MNMYFFKIYKKKYFLISLILCITIIFSSCSLDSFNNSNNNLEYYNDSNRSESNLNQIDFDDDLVSNEEIILKNMKNSGVLNNSNLTQIKNDFEFIKNESEIILEEELKIANNKFNNYSNNNSSFNYNYNNNNNNFKIHNNITATKFWIGESASNENAYISNSPSCFDENWLEHYGGIDNLIGDDFFPINFKPKENPFYFALPLSEYDDNGNLRNFIKEIPWFNESYLTEDGLELKKSLLKNKWIKIINPKNNLVAYAQWEDCGPFIYDDFNYVFGNNSPKNKINSNAGLDLSPAIIKYLNLTGMDKVNWIFVNENEIPNGPWNKIITRSQFCYDKNCNYIKSDFRNSSPIKENLIKSNLNTWYKPNINISWQWQLMNCENVNTNYDVDLYDIDLFDTPEETIDDLHKKEIKVICYFSAGSYEDWREDAKDFPNEILGNTLDNWEGEKWLDIRRIDLLGPIMKKRMDLAVQKKCDGIEPDNIDGYSNNNGFSLSFEDQLKYNKWLAKEAHNRNLSIGLKNDLDQIKELVNYFDFAINEQCFEYEECDLLLPFIRNGKAVLGVEYELNKNQFCDRANSMNFSFLKMNYELNGGRDSCRN